MKKIIVLVFLTLMIHNSKGQSKVLTAFIKSDTRGCSCYILEKDSYFKENKYLVTINFAGEWQDRTAEILLGKNKLKLRIDKTSSKSLEFGIKEYYEIYKNDIFKIEIRIDYKKTKQVGEETDLYNIILTIRYKGEIEKIITKGFCGC